MNNTHWLKHDCNAQHDPKIIDLLIKHKWEGYGLFWALVERLSLESNYKLKRKYDRIAFALRADKERIKSLVEDFELFILEDDYFYSESLMKRMEKLDLIKQKRAIAGAKGGKSKANAKQLLSKPVANSSRLDKIREDKSRVDKSKVLEVKKQEFFTSVHKYSDFSKTMRDDFISYWCEFNHSRTKMKWQLQRTFEIKRRLTTWKNNNFNNGQKNGFISDADYDQQKKDARNRAENAKLKELNKHIWD